MSRALAVLLGLAAGTASAAPARKQPPLPAALVIFDLRQPRPGPGSAARGSEALAFAERQVMRDLLGPIERALDPDTPVAERARAAQETGDKALHHAERSAVRTVSARGEMVRVVTLVDARLATDGNHWEVAGLHPDLSFDEQPRDSRIEMDLKTLVQLGVGLSGLRATRGETTTPVTWLSVKDYRLRTERATLAITASLTDKASVLASGDAESSPPADLALAGPGGSGAPDKRENLKLALITGPREHWFLSADVPLNSASQLKRNEQSGLLELAGEPSTFYVGVNLLLGDLLAARQSVADVVALKLMVKASRSPLESLGFGLALRGRHLRKYGLDFDLISPFVGWTFTHEDRASSMGAIVRDGGRNSELRFGVCLNLDKSLAWVKGGK